MSRAARVIALDEVTLRLVIGGYEAAAAPEEEQLQAEQSAKRADAGRQLNRLRTCEAKDQAKRQRHQCQRQGDVGSAVPMRQSLQEIAEEDAQDHP